MRSIKCLIKPKCKRMKQLFLFKLTLFIGAMLYGSVLLAQQTVTGVVSDRSEDVV